MRSGDRFGDSGERFIYLPVVFKTLLEDLYFINPPFVFLLKDRAGDGQAAVSSG